MDREGRIAVLLGIANAVGVKLAGGVVETLDEQRLSGRQRAVPQQPQQQPQPQQPQPRQPAAQPAPAASSELPGVFVGIKAGANMVDVYGDDAEFYTNTVAAVRFAGGSYLMVRAGDVGVELGLYYTQKGFDWDFFDGSYPDDIHQVWTFNYLEVPLTAKLYVAANSPLYLGVGVYMAFYLDGAIDEEFATLTSNNGSYTIEDYYSLNTFDYGGLLTFGADIPAGKKTLVNLEMRMGLGFASWLDDPSRTPKHLVVSFLGGIGFAP